MTIRTQADGLGNDASKAARRNYSEPKVVRPEFGPDTDVRRILTRYGALPQRDRQAIYTETETNLDLQTALARMTKASEAFAGLPLDTRMKYGTAQGLWDAYTRGELEMPATPDPKPTVEIQKPEADPKTEAKTAS